MKDSHDRSYEAYEAEAHMLWPHWTKEEIDLRYQEAMAKRALVGSLEHEQTTIS